jgi:hypothetical protein
MKRILIALLTCVALAGCGYGNNNGANNGTDNGTNNGAANAPNGNTGTDGGGTGGAGANGEATQPPSGTGTEQPNGGPAGGTAGGNSMNDKGGASGAATAGSVAILQPAEGATVSSKQPVELQYRVEKSPRGDHVHISVDNDKPDIVRALSGTYQILPLSPGDHAITVAEITRSHAATGNQATLYLHVE